jgi:phosphatidylserine decarboxylase
MSVGHAPGEQQWTPDMRKDEAHITEADKADAKRRIQGQVAEESAPDDSASGPDADDLQPDVGVGVAIKEKVKESVGVPPVAASMAG